MSDDRWHERLSNADLTDAVMLPPDQLAECVFRRAQQRRRRRRVFHGAAAVMVVAAATLWSRGKPPENSHLVQTPPVATSQDAEATEVWRAELERLVAEANARSRALERGRGTRFGAVGVSPVWTSELAAEARLADPNAITRALAQALDESAEILVRHAARLNLEFPGSPLAAATYRETIDAFPDSYWSVVARRRLEEMASQKEELQ